eukprot:TRINITY_DN6008_c0_g1_i1.p1 TRINITY_DN6008_c0_g1~~TRINITY_DN6008_c0_g1_i1.p1  ORF type:complete len:935 (-),score=197.27 TRINITY_DN6008_c0_g1_i1:59-2647(-)
MDVLAHPAVTDVIIPLILLEELKGKQAQLAERLRKLVADPAKRFYVFSNEYHQDTYIEKEASESINDRNDRAIRVTAAWYSQHLGGAVPVLLVSNDAGCRAKAAQEGLPSMTALEWAKQLGSTELLDIAAPVEFKDESHDVQFTDYLDPALIQAGLREGTLVAGVLHVSGDDKNEATITIENMDKDVLISGASAMNRAINGDKVAVRLLTAVTDEQPRGRVVGIVKMKRRQYAATFEERDGLTSGQTVAALVVPVDRRVPRIRVITRQATTLAGQRIVVQIDKWDKHSKYPSGHYVRTLGPIGDREAESEVLLVEHDVPRHPFAPAVSACLPQMPWAPTPADYAAREDLRHLNICSVDPPGCTDIDDALHCRPLPNGNFECGVHIADVSHFVRPDNAMDMEAQLRCTTVYLVGRRIDMLPELLGTNLCSLRSNVERFAFSVIWELTPDAHVVSARYCKSVILSRASFTYQQAQDLIDKPDGSELARDINQLNVLARHLKQRRREAGSLVLASPAMKFQLDEETHDPTDVTEYVSVEANYMVEEFMLLANIATATKILDSYPVTALLRRHPVPNPHNFDTLVGSAARLGIRLDPTNSRTLADTLDQATRADDPYFNKLIRILTTRCMTQALYFCTGTLPREQYSHYGLACPLYTHFTSPIRRYADVVVHRLLAAAIGVDEMPSQLTDKQRVTDFANEMNYRHHMAQLAGRASSELSTVFFFKGKVLQEEGRIVRVRANAVGVLVPRFGVEGLAFVAPREGSPAWVYDKENDTLTNQSLGVCLRLFDRVKVQLSIDTSSPYRPRLALDFVEPAIPKVERAPARSRSTKAIEVTSEELASEAPDVTMEDAGDLPQGKKHHMDSSA